MIDLCSQFESQHHLHDPGWNLDWPHATLLRSQAVSQRRLGMVLQETENKQQGAWYVSVTFSVPGFANKTDSLHCQYTG